ncbi:MAG: xylulokinase [bacterium]|nr:xylulokinase [bacterium]
MPLILAHDLGTTGNKATLFRDDGKLVASAFAGYETRYPAINWAEQDPSDWWKAFCRSSRQLLAQAGVEAREIGVVSFSGQMMGCLPVDVGGRPLRPSIIWADQRAEGEAQLLRERVGEETVYGLTGHRISPAYSLEKILWVRDHEPEIFRQTHKVLHAKDYLIYRLTGEFVTDYSDASGMNAFDLQARTWAPQILDAVGVPAEILPTLRSSIDVVGEVRPEAAGEAGLAPGTPVVMGGGDGPCAAVGAGVVRQGTAYNYVGSSSWIALATAAPIQDPERRTFNFHHLDPRMIMPTGTMQTAGGSYQWFRNQLGGLEAQEARERGVDSYEILDREAEAIPPGAGNLIYLPYLMGERAPHWNPRARGAFIGLTMTHTRAHMTRAVLEGVAFNLRIILDAFRRQGAGIEQMRLIGGGARGRLWRQIIADVYGLPVLRPRYLEEATSLGAAVAGGIGVGLIKDFSVAEQLVEIVEVQSPDPAAGRRYAELYPVFCDAYTALVPIFERLARATHLEV